MLLKFTFKLDRIVITNILTEGTVKIIRKNQINKNCIQNRVHRYRTYSDNVNSKLRSQFIQIVGKAYIRTLLLSIISDILWLHAFI